MLIFQAKGAGKGKEHCLESWKSLYKKTNHHPGKEIGKEKAT
jgi:hypothetical protein